VEQRGGTLAVSVARAPATGSTPGERIAAYRDLEPMVPASNEKLRTAFAGYELLGANTVFDTTVVATGPIVDGELRGDLVLVGGGNPTLTAEGPDSLTALAAAVSGAGVKRVQGSLIVDVSRYDRERTTPGWPDSAWPSAVGALSAIVVDRNRSTDALADPAVHATNAFRTELRGTGIEIAGPNATREKAPSPAGTELARRSSAPLGALIADMLTNSNNLTAELITKELGWRTAGKGTTVDGLRAVGAVLESRCVAVGTALDGSGLSGMNRQTAADLRLLTDTTRTRPWARSFRDGLAIGGTTGTLVGRFTGPAVRGRVWAKTGGLANARTLTGELVTRRGDTLTFSVLVNGNVPNAEAAIDAYVTALVTSGGEAATPAESSHR